MEKIHYFDAVETSAEWLRQRVKHPIEAIVVLSGGLDDFVSRMQVEFECDTAAVPHFPRSRAHGHAGKLIVGRMHGRNLAVLRGRQHVYEGYSAQHIVFPYFVLHAIGAKYFIATNAVGGIRHDLNAGDLVLIRDHINLMGNNPLIGVAIHRPEKQFPDMTRAYAPELRKVALDAAGELKLPMAEGVYVAVTGPSYETPAEIAAFRNMGADVVGMSTVPEVIAAAFLDMRTLVISAVANPAADRHVGEMKHEDVLRVMRETAPKIVDLLTEVVKRLPKEKE